jgi:hypothetical protein
MPLSQAPQTALDTERSRRLDGVTHQICAVVAPTTARAAERLGTAVVELTDALQLVPMTNQLFDALNDPNAAVVEPFFLMTTHVLGRLGSSLDVFAYIETEYFGGSGTQRAGVWRGTKTLVAPREGSASVNAALAALGVTRGGALDEWDAVGLVRFRTMDALAVASRSTIR